jgi:plasmid stabilization system protein ParE
MGFKVLITDNALDNLQKIVQFVAQDDPVAAQRLGEKLIVRALSLANFSERDALYDAQRGIRKMPIVPYLIFYTCDKAAGVVNILHFWHGARRWPEFSQ